MHQNNVKRIIASCVAILVFLVLFYSQIFIITHIHHDCSGEACLICEEIHIAEAMIKQIGSAMQTILILITFICFIKKNISVANQFNLFNTPVEMKVRMDD